MNLLWKAVERVPASGDRQDTHLAHFSIDDLSPLEELPDPDADVGASLRYREPVGSLRAVLSAEEVTIILAHAVWGKTFSAIPPPAILVPVEKGIATEDICLFEATADFHGAGISSMEFRLIPPNSDASPKFTINSQIPSPFFLSRLDKAPILCYNKTKEI